MIQRHFDEELSDLKTKLLRMAGQAEDQIDKALTALVTRDSALARQVIERDHEVNTLDVEIDEESIRLLALHQPAARAPGDNAKPTSVLSPGRAPAPRAPPS